MPCILNIRSPKLHLKSSGSMYVGDQVVKAKRNISSQYPHCLYSSWHSIITWEIFSERMNEWVNEWIQNSNANSSDKKLQTSGCNLVAAESELHAHSLSEGQIKHSDESGDHCAHLYAITLYHLMLLHVIHVLVSGVWS